MRRTACEIANERGEIVGVRGERVLLASIQPSAGAEVALRQRDIPVSLRDRLTLPFPRAVIERRAVYEYHWCALPLYQIRQTDAIHARFPEHRGTERPFI